MQIYHDQVVLTLSGCARRRMRETTKTCLSLKEIPATAGKMERLPPGFFTSLSFKEEWNETVSTNSLQYVLVRPQNFFHLTKEFSTCSLANSSKI